MVSRKWIRAGPEEKPSGAEVVAVPVSLAIRTSSQLRRRRRRPTLICRTLAHERSSEDTETVIGDAISVTEVR